MSDIDAARELLKNTMSQLDDQLRPQDASAVVADLAYLAPALATLIARINARLAGAERLPGLYSTATDDARAELLRARAQLTAAHDAVHTLTAHLEAAHESLASLGHGDASEQPLSAVSDDPEPEPQQHWVQRR